MSMLTIFIGYFGIGLFLQTLVMAKDIFLREKLGIKTLTIEATGLKKQILIRLVEALIWPIELIFTIRITFYALHHKGKLPKDVEEVVDTYFEITNEEDKD